MRRLGIISVCCFSLFLAMPVGAQNSAFDQYRKKKQEQMDAYMQGKQKQYDDYRAEKRRQFEEYRKRKNEEFAKFLGKEWEVMPIKEAAPPPLPKPKPVVQPVAPKEDSQKRPVEITPGQVIMPKVPEAVKPIEVPLPEESEPAKRRQGISLFGCRYEVAIDNNLRLSMKNAEEKEVTRMWKRLSEDAYTPMFEDFARLNMDLNLNGWATFQLAKTIGETLQGKDTNEAAIVCTFLMTQLGYDVRLVRTGKRLIPASTTTADVSRYLGLVIEGKQYYLWADLPNGISVVCYRKNVADATRPLDFTDAQMMKLGGGRTEMKRFTSRIMPQATAQVSIRKSLINYYNTVPPILEWAVYAGQPMEKELSNQLKPALKAVIAGKSQWEATRILMQFVQSAFNYGYDHEQFGCERSLFKEETFFYPASDCEDRAILFSDLVHTIMGLDVVLLQYPEHLCTAVRFTEGGRGDFVKVDGQTYYVCDPTYTNADCGTCMPPFVGVKPKVHKIIYD